MYKRNIRGPIMDPCGTPMLVSRGSGISFLYLTTCVLLIKSGFLATLEIRENLENEFPIFQLGKTHGIWGKHKTSGKTRGICDSDPEGKGLGYVCSLTDWL